MLLVCQSEEGLTMQAERWGAEPGARPAQVSMVDGALLDALEAVARHVRRSDKPFGGIQLVLSGARRAAAALAAGAQ